MGLPAGDRGLLRDLQGGNVSFSSPAVGPVRRLRRLAAPDAREPDLRRAPRVLAAPARRCAGRPRAADRSAASPEPEFSLRETDAPVAGHPGPGAEGARR